MHAARLALAALLVVVAAAPPALAHAGDDRGPSNHRIVVEPPEVDGLRARLVEAQTRLELTVESHDEVVVLGYEGEPYLRITPEGVEENLRSPATYLNASYDGETVPDGADPEADPEWSQVAEQPTARWHDHRFHPPLRAPADPDRRQLVAVWEIPLEVDGESTSVGGAIEWVPPATAWPWWLVAAVVAAAVAVGTARVGLPALLGGVAVAVAADVARVVGIVGEVGGGASTFVEEAGIGLAGWALALATAVLAWRGRRNDALVAGALAGAVVAVTGGLLELGDLDTSQLPSSLPIAAARAVIVLALGTGAGAAVGGAVRLLRPPAR